MEYGATQSSMLCYVGLQQQPTLPSPSNAHPPKASIPKITSPMRAAPVGYGWAGMEVKLPQMQKDGPTTQCATRHDGPWCNAVWDYILCWPPARANTSASQQCPPVQSLDTTKVLTKNCGPTGKWVGRDGTEIGTSEQGWTNYSMCYKTEVVQFMETLATLKAKKPQD
ncbi:unnamed protein product, partial [Mesorhabditis spiculigera]